ncbi:MAG TPA: hypothetical protein VMZ91_13215, partial [Candidatus Paceibacterota bacterium]|nr:hypothetical protein [Candidatus Paceibacterota bacterium]
MEDIYRSGDENQFSNSSQSEDSFTSSGLSPEVREIDQELAELLKKQSAKIKVIGVGGGGGNSL